MNRIPRSEMQHLRDLIRICRESSDSRVAMQATCLRNRLDAIEREQQRRQEAHLEAIIAAERAGWGAC
jgi:hypothetical protein